MTKQRLKETDEEYEKRKKRVSATYRNLGFGLAHGGGSAILAAIIYDGTLLDIAATRYLKDVGASPQDNSTNYSGRAKQFATDMSMPITVAVGQHLYKFDHDTDTFVHYEIPGGMTTYHLGKVDGSGAFENKTYGLVVVFTSELSDVDLYLMSVNPEAIVKMVALDVADTRFTVTKSDCKVCMTLTEDGKYSRNYAENLGSDVKHPSGAISHANIDTFVDNLDGTYTCSGTAGVATLLKVYTNGVQSGLFLQADMEIIVHSGSATIVGYYDTTKALFTTPILLEDGSNLLNIRSVDSADYFYLYIQEGDVFNFTVSTNSVKEIPSSEINNYATLPAPDIRTLNTGLQTTPFKLDSLGMIDAVGDGMEWHGKEGAITPVRIITANITIEITPSIVEGVYLVNSTTGDIAMVANGTVAISSGSVNIDTTTLQVGVRSIVTVTGISIDGASALFNDFNGTIHNYTEEIA